MIGPGQYWYAKGIGTFANEVSTEGGDQVLGAADREPRDLDRGRPLRADPPHGRPAALLRRRRARALGGGRIARLRRRAPIDELAPAGDLSWGWSALGVDAASENPSDPAALARLLAQRSGEAKRSAAWEAFELIGDVLRFAPLSGAQTAAFYEVMAGIPGIEVTGDVKDGIGRPGTAFALDRDGRTRNEIILERATGRMLGSRTTLLKADPLMRDVPVGAVLGAETVVATCVVGSTDARP